jgi:hypothetical protein
MLHSFLRLLAWWLAPGTAHETPRMLSGAAALGS